VSVYNLAGVPSIVFGVFGLGFFVYFMAATSTACFTRRIPARADLRHPGPVLGLADPGLLTLPVVIVSDRRRPGAHPLHHPREGSLALGATKAETLWRMVVPLATPAMMTGLILAIARAAGEVAPLMLVGVVKLAPTLPVDGTFPFVHLERKIMHLGFHIYDVGFQSPNVEAARPLVYATALTLVILIVILNLTAISIRNHLRERTAALPTDEAPCNCTMLIQNSMNSVVIIVLHERTDHPSDPGQKRDISASQARGTSPPNPVTGGGKNQDRRNLNLYYGNDRALNNINLVIPGKKVTAFIGPSGCGKSTLLRCFNRMNDLVDICRIEGQILIDGEDIYGRVDVAELRRNVGMVFQKPNPFPKSIYENVAYGLRLQGCQFGVCWTRWWSVPCAGGAVGRGQGPPARQRLRPVRRPAAAPGDRPRHRHRAGGDPAG
jgi:hypothetical protein